MFYLPPSELWYLTAARLSVTFDDGRKGSGTGFFVFDIVREQYFLITARHVVDPKYSPGKMLTQAICSKLEISFQWVQNAGTSEPSIGYQTLTCLDPDFCFADGDTDVAGISFPHDYLPHRRDGNVYRPMSFSTEQIGTDEELGLRYAGEPVVFIGFPSNAPSKEIDAHKLYYPLLRQGVFAYPPVHGIPIEGQLGRNYGLLDSFAQSGFSGSPVVSIQKGWADGSWHPEEDFRPARVVGVVCGHYRSAQDKADGAHSGLSFFARASSIRDVIQQLAAKDA
ncbi:trypsin-like peptidase domain-containing protein [Pseudophaeobacter arcticus]|jgi:hypothetical protein|uniref:trypsin-like peptidase domain-containing protein n=1 Tax=Pseudophaeobacter arcticus TaxID=385492 RepID=UPI0039E2A59E